MTAAVFAPFVLLIAVIAYSRDSARARRDMEAILLHDYGAIAASQLARYTMSTLRDETIWALHGPLHYPDGSIRSLQPLQAVDPVTILRPVAGPGMRPSILRPYIAGAFRVTVPGRELATAGSLSPSLTRTLAQIAAPTAVNVVQLLNGLAYLALSATGMLLPEHLAMVRTMVTPILFGEVALMLWLLVVGIWVQPSRVAAPSSNAS